MIITRKKFVPLHWAFYAQLPLLLSIYGNFVINAPFLLLMKRFIDNPAAIMGLISIEVYVTVIGGPFISWLSDRIWTRFGRRKQFIVFADVGKGLILLFMPFAPNLWVLIALRWIYGALGDFGSMTQALVYEVVPPPQRGRMAGFFQSSIQFGNLVFFFLLIGRFDDTYFMGPFQGLGELNGGNLMFFLAAMLLLGIALFEGLGIKEIKPPDMQSLRDGRKPGQNLFTYFVKTFCKDVFAKDFMPLYTLLFVNVMFGISLGIFQPLLFTEQWGYSLQDMGNTVAVGVFLAVLLSLLSGWLADKWGKLNTFVLATAGSFAINIFYTVFVAFQPDNRPTLWQIIAFGNLGLVFQMTKGVVIFPLMMEYVKRSRMGAANAGMGLFQALVRNSMSLFIGFWLVWWSLWFFPQAGYHVQTTFPSEIDADSVREILADGGIDAPGLILRPLHQFGVDGATSRRWWIHRDDEAAHDLLKERKTLTNKLSPLENKQQSPLLSEEKRLEIRQEVDAMRAQLEAIDAALSAGVDALRQEVIPVLSPLLTPAGGQIRNAAFDQDRLGITLSTIEALEPELVSDLIRVLDGPQYRIVSAEDAKDPFRTRPDIGVDILESASPGLAFSLRFDPGFLALAGALSEVIEGGGAVFDLSTALISLHRAELGDHEDSFEIDNAIATSDGVKVYLSYDLRFGPEALQAEHDLLLASLSEEASVSRASGEAKGGGWVHLQLELSPSPVDSAVGLVADRLREITPRLNALLPSTHLAGVLAPETYLRLVSALAERPFYITVPEHTPRANHREREYEYFFSSQTLQIATDLIGFGIIWFLLVMEKRGVVRRAGVEEDAER